MKLLAINLEKKESRIEDVEEIGVVERGINNFIKKREVFLFGSGPLAFTLIPGTNRLVFVNYSDLWDGLFISTMGGASLPLTHSGLNLVELEGKAEKYTVVKISNFNNQTKVEFIKIDEKELENIFNRYGKFRGTYALQHYIFDKYAKEYLENDATFRIMVVGPAALKTKLGVLCSTLIEKGKFIDGLDSFAGRGAFGSTLVKKHNVVGIIYGGNLEIKPYDLKKLNDIFKKKFGDGMFQVINKKTVKYRYDENLKTGGTFGVNFSTLGTWFLSFNWNSIFFSEEDREKLYDLLKKYYLEKFNEEIIKQKNFRTCGEICPGVCKKYNPIKKKKRDYEPYEANGPNCGIFDLNFSEKLVEEIDTLGFDAIETGNMIAWIMDMLAKGVIKPEEFGLSKLPKFDYKNYNIEDSKNNAELGIEILDLILNNQIFSNGIKNAVEKLGEDAKNMIIYVPHGKGAITPNMYWMPAFILPIAIQGKFLVDYGKEFKIPYELGKSSTIRMIKELYSDNFGVCRFHRKWFEAVVEDLLKEILGIEIDVFKYSKELVNKIYSISPKAALWESEKAFDLIKTYLEKLYSEEKSSKELKKWVEKFEKDKFAAGKEYYKEILKGIQEVLE